MLKTLRAMAAIGAVALAATVSAAEARDHLKIVGSSTVYPYAQAVAEEFAQKTGNKPPVLESTGTGGGMKLFCSGIGQQHPDITNASRAMKKSEWDLCVTNGVTNITEVLIGYDGLSVAHARQSPDMDLSKAQLYLALAKQVPVNGKLVDNPYKTWRQIDPKLPDAPIRVYGPPPTSGTRDAFVELVLHEVCLKGELPFWKKKAEEIADRKALKEFVRLNCSAMRSDGPFIEAGENDNLIVQKLNADPEALGIFGYSFLFENEDNLKPIRIGGVLPSIDSIADGSYGISRPLFFYIKNDHRSFVKGMDDFIAEFVSEEAFGPDGYLSERGLVPLPDEQREKVREAATRGTPMTRFGE
ncbi:MAG TPA: phosphate ABC transporter substrate-binding protein [Thermopetrobacter sp.]|nr:phosphate ABC transporter substrate-binding protein [Thermopetrobacter sp.]